jgi:hypothetical protein
MDFVMIWAKHLQNEDAVPGNQGLPCLLKGLFGGAGNRGDGGLTGRGRITIQEIFYRDLGAFLSRSRAQIRAQHAQRRRILAISDTCRVPP